MISVRSRLLLAVSTLSLTVLAALRPERVGAASLVPTPGQTRGPFYPSELPLDRDNDLVQVAGRPGTARGQVTNVIGRVLTEDSRPVAGARRSRRAASAVSRSAGTVIGGASSATYFFGREYTPVSVALPIELALTMNPASDARASLGSSSFSTLSACRVKW